MEKITIRKATLEDMDSLLLFEQGVITAERPFDHTLRPGKIHYYNLRELITADHIELLVAILGGEPAQTPGGEVKGGKLIGSGYARIENSKHYLIHPQHAYLGFMYVLPEYRGKGVNQLIIDGLKDWALTKGMIEMYLEVYPQNAGAIKAYERAGFSNYLLKMRMGIGE
ncbi:MAG TPA: GNAT family N-acetyltransferase [Puia sp.]|nr:GNAT family N-acetyltransferase [Puia sp.]